MGPLIAALLACHHAPPATQANKGLQPATTTLAALQQARSARRVALVVGVDRYGDPSFPPLRHAEADARAMADHLGSPEVGGFDDVRLLLGADARREGVVELLRSVRDTLRHDDVLVVYFSGHGTRSRDPEGVWHRFLLPTDARVADPSTTAIDLAELQAFFSSLAPARKALIVDACFDGDGRSALGPGAPDQPDTPLSPAPARVGDGEAHLFATSSGRPAREDDTLGHGVYTWFLLDAMTWSFGEADADGDGVVTAWEAHDWARGRTIDQTGGAQVPEATLRVVGEADLVLAGRPEARRREDRALVYLYPTEHDRLAGATLVVDGREKGRLPGTLPVSPGRHHVVVHTSDGATAVDGTMKLAAGRAYTVDEVQRLAQGPTSSLGLRAVVVGAPGLGEALGAGAVGSELVWTDRRDGPVGHGFCAELGLGLAGSPSRPAADLPRPVTWATAGAGWQGDRGILRARLGLGASFVWLPPSAPLVGIDPGPEGVGWWWTGAGPQGVLGLVLGRGWTATASGRSHVAALDPDLDGRVSAVPWTTIGLGLEIDR